MTKEEKGLKNLARLLPFASSRRTAVKCLEERALSYFIIRGDRLKGPKKRTLKANLVAYG